MADDRKRKARHAKGEVKESAGELLGDREQKREGRLAQRQGGAEQDAREAERLDEATAREEAARMARMWAENR